MKIKTILVIIILLFITGTGIYFIHKESRTYFSSNYRTGNTSGNLSNNGLFCEQDNLVYFSNPNDDGTLYSMNQNGTDFKKLSNDKVAYINADEHYIYYARRNNERKDNKHSVLDFNNTGLYRIKRNGAKIMNLYSKLSDAMNLYQNYLYYLRPIDGNAPGLYQVKIDGTEEKRISNEQISPSSIVDGIIYYSGIKNDHGIHALDLSTGFSTILYDGNTYQSIATKEYIYFLSQADHYSIQRISIDGANLETIVPQRCFTYNISLDGKHLYYQVDDTQNNGIYQLDLNTYESTLILSGNYKNIHITSNCVFFQVFDSDITYQFEIGNQNNQAEIFLPPTLK